MPFCGMPAFPQTGMISTKGCPHTTQYNYLGFQKMVIPWETYAPRGSLYCVSHETPEFFRPVHSCPALLSRT